MPTDIGIRELKEPIVQFIPRKKRKQTQSSQETLVKPTQSDEVQVDTESCKGSTEMPTWRLNKTEQLVPESQPKHLKWFEKSPEDMTDRDWRIMFTDLNIQSARSFHPLLGWNELKNSKLIKYLLCDFSQPTPIQRCAVSLALQGQDVIALAPTGSGKTLGFLIPMIEIKPVKSLILAPTRELAIQISQELRKLPHSLRIALLVGGMDISDQSDQLHLNPAIIIATPGRLLDFMQQKLVDLSDLAYLVFDEADRMIDLGFEAQINEIMHLVPPNRQTLMFSATWPLQVQKLSERYLGDNYFLVKVGRTAEKIEQTVEFMKPEAKMGNLLRVLKKHGNKTAIVFVSTRASAEKVSEKLVDSGIKCTSLHGNLNQSIRNHNLIAFAQRKATKLVATDVASRGMDIPGVSLVINFDMPSTIDTYIHRIGRTGRAEQMGHALSFVTEGDQGLFADLKAVLRQSNCSVPSFL